MVNHYVYHVLQLLLRKGGADLVLAHLQRHRPPFGPYLVNVGVELCLRSRYSRFVRLLKGKALRLLHRLCGALINVL